MNDLSNLRTLVQAVTATRRALLNEGLPTLEGPLDDAARAAIWDIARADVCTAELIVALLPNHRAVAEELLFEFILSSAEFRERRYHSLSWNLETVLEAYEETLGAQATRALLDDIETDEALQRTIDAALFNVLD